jgi:phosphoribosylformylglycinamidine cyclo-ligase
MVVDDIAVCGARPLFMTDYLACGRVVPERIATIVGGIAAACEQAGCALVGGETAEHPGLLEADEYDLAGAAVGVVEADAVLGAHRVRPGDVLVALASSGLHSNGYSLVRRVVAAAGWDYHRHVEELGRTLGEELLTPTRIYAPHLVDLARLLGADLRALAHVTGGGVAANLARVLPVGLLATVDRGTWTPPAIVELVARLGRVPRADLERTLNLGIGMVAVVGPDAAGSTVAALSAGGVPAWVCGEVTVAPGADHDEATRGAKGVDGGAARLVGSSRRPG